MLNLQIVSYNAKPFLPDFTGDLAVMEVNGEPMLLMLTPSWSSCEWSSSYVTPLLPTAPSKSSPMSAEELPVQVGVE